MTPAAALRGGLEETKMNKYRVDNQFFKKLADARCYARQIKAGLPSDAVVTIFRAEVLEQSNKDVMWVPYE